MIVYADREEVVDTGAFRSRIEQASDAARTADSARTVRVRCDGCALSDADDEVCFEGRLPEQHRGTAPEGYAFYCLYPEMYRDAALRFFREQGASSSVVIGIRSIGASLSTVVADTVQAVWRFTVRPRGHPFDRELRLSAEFGAACPCACRPLVSDRR